MEAGPVDEPPDQPAGPASGAAAAGPAQPARPTGEGLLHAERLWPSGPTWLLVVLFGGLCAAVMAAFGPTAAAAGGLVGALLTVWSLVSASTRVEVSAERGLRAGRARVPARLLGAAEPAAGEGARFLRGPGLDARTFLCLRGWVDGVVLVELHDPADPTPSWLVSTRRPQQLAAALESASAAARSGA